MKILSKIFTVALLLIATFVAQAQRPRVWTVTNAGDGAAGTLSGAGTLRNTIATATGGDIIQFSPSLNNVIILLNSTVVIDKSITIMGNGNHLNRIQLNNTTTGSVFTVTNSTQFSMFDVTVANGANALTIDTNGEISLSGCVFNSRVDIYSPQLLYVYKCDFRGLLAGLRVMNIGTTARQPLLGANSYFVASSTFNNNNNGTPPFSSVLAISVSSTSIFPINFRVSDSNFTNNLIDDACLDYALNSTDSIKVTNCLFENNRVRNNNISLHNASAIRGRGGNILVMSSFLRGNSENNIAISSCNLIAIRNLGSLSLFQNQITGNNGAGIRIINNSPNHGATGGVLICRQNTIAHNNNAVIVANNLQVANSYLETTFNVTNPLSLGGNYFANPPSWSINSDILPSPTTTLNPFFVAPITSLLPVQTIPTTAGNYRLAANSILIGRAVSNQVPQDIFDYNSNGNFGETVPFDIVGNPRRFDRGVDIGAYERQANGGGLRAENGEEIAETLTNNPQTVVYPNPANEVLNINYELSTGAEKAEIAIFNTIGQVVYQNTVSAESKAMKVDVSNFEKGLYVIKIVDNQGNTQNQKVVVQ